MEERWWKNAAFGEKRALLEAGVKAFLRGDEEGAIHCIKTLLPEIEGILRMLYLSETGRGSKVKAADPVDHIIQKGRKAAGSPHSLLLPDVFLRYLKEVFFAEFNLETGKVILSRHSSSHGVARPEDYTQVRALQAILVLDQIAFYT